MKWYTKTWFLWIAFTAAVICMLASIWASGWAALAYGVAAILLTIHVLANEEVRRQHRAVR